MPLDHGKKSLDQYCSRLTPSTWSINNNVWHRRTWRWQLMCRQVQILATSLNCSRVVCTETPSFRHNNLERIEIHSPYKSTWILAIGETNSTWDTWIKACLLYRPGTHLDLDFEDCVPWLSDISGIHHVFSRLAQALDYTTMLRVYAFVWQHSTQIHPNLVPNTEVFVLHSVKLG